MVSWCLQHADAEVCGTRLVNASRYDERSRSLAKDRSSTGMKPDKPLLNAMDYVRKLVGGR